MSRFVSAVDDVSLSVSKGETLVILGESGSGKTTLGRMIVGLERLDGGSIQCDSEQVRLCSRPRCEEGEASWFSRIQVRLSIPSSLYLIV